MIDLHCHSSASDGSYSPKELINMAEKLNITHLALTDHDTTAGISEFMAQKSIVNRIPGIEISVEVEKGELHIVGLFIDINNKTLQEMEEEVQYYRRKRNEKMIAALSKLVKKNVKIGDLDVSGYARFFEKYTMDEDGNSVLNPHWESNNEYNLMFLKAQEKYANDLLRAKKRLFLNDVYDMLGLPPTKAGQVVGWVYDAEHPIGDNYVDFGLYADNLSYSDFANGFEPAILLDFNVDGNIWELM